jgi:iron complex outermembrane receptor protein
MTVKKLFWFCSVFMCQYVLGQNDTITKLKEVIVSDFYLKNASKTQTVLQFDDSFIKKNQPLLTDLLNYNSTIYFKQYGCGMLSTVSFRGTTASQTAVIWNGININSQLTGSTDFNTINTSDYNSVAVKAGGGSVIYGSGAIGGSVHLNNDLSFVPQNTTTIQTSYGSFNTIGVNLNAKVATDKWSLQLGLTNNSSTNDYIYVERFDWKGNQRKNLNGEYINTSYNANLGYRINAKNQITLYSQSSSTDRNISLILPSESKTKYVNSFSRNLLDYTTKISNVSISLKNAFVYENYKYYPDIDNSDFTYGSSESFISKLNFAVPISSSFKLDAILDYNTTNGYGSSFGNNTRNIGSGTIVLKHIFNSKWQSDFNIRQEITTNYEPPLLLSLGSAYVFNSIYTLKINVSTNYRIPTFNDLYWEGSSSGNVNLKPESSKQIEVGNVFKFKKLILSPSLYYMKIKDLISWIPSEGGNWSPQNTAKVTTMGTDVLLNWKIDFGKNNFDINATYGYTISKNELTQKQLFFVPYNKATLAVSHSYKQFAIDYQFLYNGFVFTRADNNPLETIKAYQVSNLGISYDFMFLESSKLGFQVLNIMNLAYQSLEQRPLPGRNFNMYINLKF